MLISIIKSAFRNIEKRKFNTFLSIIGLSIGLSSFIIISLFIKYEVSWDSYHDNYERIFRIQTYKTVHNEKIMQTPPALFEYLEDRYNDIEMHSIVYPNAIEFLSSSELNEDMEVEGIYADQEYIKMFSYNFTGGSPDQALDDPFSILLSSTLAKKLFKDQNPVGKTILLQKKHNLKITGVYNDLPLNSHLRPEFIISFRTLETIWGTYDLYDNWNWNSFFNYILIKKETNITVLDEKLKDILRDKILTDYRQLYLRPLAKLYMYSTNNNYMLIVYLLAVFSIFVLVLASINYMNLSISSSFLRFKEIGIKKVIGAGRSQLMIQIFLESFLLTMISLILSFILVELSLNFFNQTLKVFLSFSMLFNDGLLIILLSIILIVSIVSSIYPAWLISSFNSIDLFNKKFIQNRGSNISLKKVLIGFQFTISIILITLTVLITKQIKYTQTMDVGFEKSNLIFVEIFPTNSEITYGQIKNRFISDPDIKSISVSQGFPIHSSKYTDIKMINWEGSSRDEMTEVYSFWASREYINTLDLKIIAGRGFSEQFTGDVNNTCLINETAASQFGWENPIGKYINDQKLQVIGVIKDFHFHDMFNTIKPIIITSIDNNKALKSPVFFAFRINPGHENLIRSKINSTLKEFYPNDPFQVKLFTDHFKTTEIFEVYYTINSIFLFFAFIAVMLSILGVFGLVTHSLNQRTKEIAIRKISGCSTFSMIKSITFEYIVLIFMASIIGLSFAYYINSILPINYPVEKSVLDFLIAVIIALLITFLTIGDKTWKESSRNPVESLRYE